MPATDFLNADGRPSMATIFLMVHHGLRRDLARLATGAATANDPERIAALREGWKAFSDVLHGHHHAEDSRMFPSMRAQAAEAIDALGEDHRAIDPLLARVDAALATFPEKRAEAVTALGELVGLLDRHLSAEEAVIIPFIRGAPLSALAGVPASEMPGMIDGFAWSAEGVAADIVALTFAELPELVRARLPEARDVHAAKVTRLWGPRPATASRTSIPERS